MRIYYAQARVRNYAHPISGVYAPVRVRAQAHEDPRARGISHLWDTAPFLPGPHLSLTLNCLAMERTFFVGG